MCGQIILVSEGLFKKNWFGVNMSLNVRGGKHNAKCVSKLTQPNRLGSPPSHAKKLLGDLKWMLHCSEC